MTHISTKMKRKHDVAICEYKRAGGKHNGKGYTIATKADWHWWVPKSRLFRHAG